MDIGESKAAPEHVDASDLSGPGAVPAEDPFGGGLNVTVSIPETVEIKMVDATTLTDYEIWMAITSILSSIAVGFIVAAVQTPGMQILFWNGVSFGILFLISLATAIWKRSSLSQKSRSIQLRPSRR